MYDNYNYPAGADNPDAPWNQDAIEPIDVDVTISQSLHRDTTIAVSNYTTEVWKEVEYDEDGAHIFGGVDYDFSSCNINREYDIQEYDIPKLLDKLKELTTEKLERESTSLTNYEKFALKSILKSCDEWILDESEVLLNR